MDTVQILGLIAFSICVICGTVLLMKRIDSKRIESVEQRRIDKEQTERIAKDNAWSMWQAERQLRILAETREGIAKEQLRKERAKTVRLEQILEGTKLSDTEGVRVVW